jgi:hypothetical protein
MKRNFGTADWDWDRIVADAKNNPQRDTVGYAYLGSLINPSGKYYLPFACSNVEPCPECGGDGCARKNVKTVNQERKDMPHRETKCRYCDGTGERVADEYMNLEAFGGVKVGDKFLCNVCNGTKKQSVTCPTCDGSGSEEAREDELFWAELDKEAEKHGGWIESGEGDPCDSFFCVAIESEEDQWESADEPTEAANCRQCQEEKETK